VGLEGVEKPRRSGEDGKKKKEVRNKHGKARRNRGSNGTKKTQVKGKRHPKTEKGLTATGGWSYKRDDQKGT